MTSPAKTVRRLDAHIPLGIPVVLDGVFFRDDQLRHDDVFDNAGKVAFLLDRENKTEQLRADQFRRVQLVAINIGNKRRLDGLTRRFRAQMTVRQFSAPSVRKPSHPHSDYATSPVRVHANIPGVA